MEFDVEFRYNEADLAPVTVRYLRHKSITERKDCDYIIELSFSGSDSLNHHISVQTGRLRCARPALQ